MTNNSHIYNVMAIRIFSLKCQQQANCLRWSEKCTLESRQHPIDKCTVLAISVSLIGCNGWVINRSDSEWNTEDCPLRTKLQRIVCYPFLTFFDLKKRILRMAQTKRMRMAEEKLSKDSNETDSRKNDWDNLPYPAIRTIAKFDFQSRYHIQYIICGMICLNIY